MADQKVLVEFIDANKSYDNGQTVILDHFNFSFFEGETHVICGRSGAGKSTLIRCINYLEKLESGFVLVKGKKVNKYTEKDVRQTVAMVFQNFNLFPNMTVLGNVTFGPINSLHKSKKEAEETGKIFLEKVGLIDKIFSKPSTLSGGQQQRVAIARALNMFPDLILFDEPTSALDPETVGEVVEIMEELANENRSMIVVTHEMAFAKEAADRISFLENGKFIETNTSKEFFTNPKHESVAKFISQIQVM